MYSNLNVKQLKNKTRKFYIKKDHMNASLPPSIINEFTTPANIDSYSDMIWIKLFFFALKNDLILCSFNSLTYDMKKIATIRVFHKIKLYRILFTDNVNVEKLVSFGVLSSSQLQWLEFSKSNEHGLWI